MDLYVTINFNKDNPQPSILINSYNLLKTTYPTSRFAICKEIGGKNRHLHLHIYIEFPDLEYNDENRIAFRRFLQKNFDGDVRISKEKVRDKISAIAYTIKDGDYKTHNLHWHVFQEALQRTHPKQVTFTMDYQNWFDNPPRLSGEDYLVGSLLHLYIKHRVPFHKDKMIGQIKSKLAKDDINYFNRVKEYILDNL